MKTLTIIAFTFLPLSVLAAEQPSMSYMWVELILLIVMLFVLKLANFSNQHKFIAFVTYILSGIITKTIWFPVLLFVIMFIIFKQNTDDDSWT